MARRYSVFGIELCEPLDLTVIAPPRNPRQGVKRMTRNWDGGPETEVDRRFHDLRDSGYTGPIDQDGYAAFDVTLRAERRSIVRTVIFLAVLAAAVLIAISYLSGCTAGTHSGPAVQQQTPVIVTRAVPASPVTPDGPSTLTRPVGDWIVTNDALADYKLPGQLPHDDTCAHPGHLNGEQIAVRVDHAGDPAGTPCPQGTYPGKVDEVVAGWIVSDPNTTAVDVFATVTCVNRDVTGQLVVGVKPEQQALFHLGDPCPEGPSQRGE